jgi:hypothetical protein
MNKLTKQWFDEVNREGETNYANAESKIYYKKPTTSTQNGLKSPSDNSHVAYHNLNASAASNILMESSDEDDDQDEQVIIDKIKLINQNKK